MNSEESAVVSSWKDHLSKLQEAMATVNRWKAGKFASTAWQEIFRCGGQIFVEQMTAHLKTLTDVLASLKPDLEKAARAVTYFKKAWEKVTKGFEDLKGDIKSEMFGGALSRIEKEYKSSRGYNLRYGSGYINQRTKDKAYQVHALSSRAHRSALQPPAIREYIRRVPKERSEY